MSMWGLTDQGASSKQSIENFWKRDTIIGLQFFNLLLHLKCLFFASQVVQRTRELWSYSAMRHPSLCFGAHVLHAKILSCSKYLETKDFGCRRSNWVNIMQLHVSWPNMKILFLTICLVLFWSFWCHQNISDLSGRPLRLSSTTWHQDIGGGSLGHAGWGSFLSMVPSFHSMKAQLGWKVGSLEARLG